jgi:hypothetical protein
LGLTTCHTCLVLGLALDWIQWYWVWQLARPVHAWTQRLDGLKDVGSDSSQYLYIFGLSAWLSLRILGLVTRQTYTCFGLAVSWAQECSSSDPYIFGLSTWLRSKMLNYHPPSNSFKIRIQVNKIWWSIIKIISFDKKSRTNMSEYFLLKKLCLLI